MARMTLYLNDAEHARLAERAMAAGVSRSGLLRGLIMDVPPVDDLPGRAVAGYTPGRAPNPPPRGGEFSKSDQAGKAKR